VIDKKGKKLYKSRTFHVAKKDLNFKYGWKPGNPSPGSKVKYFMKDISGGVPPYRIRWSLDGNTVGRGKSGDFTYRGSSKGVLAVSIEDSRGQVKTGASEIKTGGNSLDFKFWWTRSYPIVGQTVRFGVKNIEGGTPPYKIIWRMNGRIIGKGGKIRYTFQKSGKNIVEVEVTDSRGITKTGKESFNVEKRPKR